MASIGFLVVTTSLALFTTPIIVRALGKSQFGVVRSLTEATSFLSLIAQMITLSLVPRLGAALGANDRSAAARTLSTGLRLYGVAAVVIIVLGLAATPVLGSLVRFDPSLIAATRKAWLIGLIGLPFIVLTPMRILMEVDQKGYLLTFALLGQSLLTVGLSVALAVSGWGVVGVSAATLCGQVAYYAWMTGYVARAYPEMSRAALAARPTREDWRGVLALSGPTLVAMASDQVGVLSDSLVLTGVLGPQAATTLFVTQRLPTLAKLILAAIGAAVWPSLVQLHARGERDLFNRRLVELTRLVVLLGVAGLVPVVAYNGDFVARWMGPGYDGGPAIAAASALDAVLLTLVTLFSIPFVTTGRVAMVAWPAAASAVLNLGASVLFSKWFGPIGPLLGTMLSTLCVGAWYLPWRLRARVRDAAPGSAPSGGRAGGLGRGLRGGGLVGGPRAPTLGGGSGCWARWGVGRWRSWRWAGPWS